MARESGGSAARRDARRMALAVLAARPEFLGRIADRVKDLSHGMVTVSPSSMAAALRAMEAEGVVRSWEASSFPRRGGARRYYELTARGRSAATLERCAQADLWGLIVPPEEKVEPATAVQGPSGLQ